MNDQFSSKIKQTTAALAVASALAIASGGAFAAGLGKIKVLSGLGQPLRAELELNAAKEDLGGMSARLAPADVFKQAGVEYQSLLLDLRFSIEKRDGKQVVKVSSSKPINEPFLDFLVELNWPAGRLIREYTFLLDPPEVVVRSAARPVSVAEAKVVDAPASAAPAAESAPAEKPVVQRSTVQTPAKPAAPVAENKSAGGGSRPMTTHAGDTLNKIAAATRYEGVSLEQMLVGLYRANPDAFFDGNINRLKKGVILNVPDQATVASVTPDAAHAELQAQARDWNSYRQKLAAGAAAAPARDGAASQTAGGKITPKVEDKAAPAQAPKDQVKVSRAEMAAKGGKGASEEDRVAMDKALKEAQERLSSLEKNIGDMQKLLEMKNQKLAELEQQLSGKGAPPAAPTPAPAEVKAPETPVPAKPEGEAKPADAKPAEAAPAAESKPAEPVPPKPKAVPLPPPEPEPTLVDSLLADPVPLAGAGGIVALLAGFLLYRRRRSAAPAAAVGGNTTLAAPDTGMGAYHAPGGASIDTSQTPPQSSEFSQAGPGTIDTDEVDPVAEAEVYMAYGRDAQAEEILLEALQKDGQRTAVHVKLLEIYSGRKSVKQFETLAEELYAQTGGHGPDWAKAAALGARLDPANPLYRGEAAAPAAAPALPEVDAQTLAPDDAPFDPEATMVVAPAAAEPLPSLDMMAAPAVEEAPVAAEPAALEFDLPVVEAPASAPEPEPASTVDEAHSLDFDMGSTAPAAPAPEPVVAPDADDLAHSLDFDLTPAAEPAAEVVEPQADAADLDIAMPELAAEAVMAEPEAPAASEVAAEADIALDFELPQSAAPAPAVEAMPEVEEISLPEMAVEAAEPVADLDLSIDIEAPAEVVAEEALPEPSFDLGAINLDLSAPPADADAGLELPEPQTAPAVELGEGVDLAPPAAAEAPAAGEVSDALREEVSTKLDLAKAYEEMGDLEGARELLAEVVAEGPADLAGEAREILARIGS